MAATLKWLPMKSDANMDTAQTYGSQPNGCQCSDTAQTRGSQPYWLPLLRFNMSNVDEHKYKPGSQRYYWRANGNQRHVVTMRCFHRKKHLEELCPSRAGDNGAVERPTKHGAAESNHWAGALETMPPQ